MNITNTEYLKLKKDSERLAFLEDERAMKPFIDALSNAIMSYLAITPMNKWPSFAVAGLKVLTYKYPIGALIYVNHHKKANDPNKKD